MPTATASMLGLLAGDAERVAAGPDLAGYLLVCATIVGATVGLAWLFRRCAGGWMRQRAARRSLQIIDVLPLGRRQRLCVVRCYDRTFALGVGDREVALVAELDPVVGAETEDAAAPAPADRAAFAEALERVRNALPKPRAGAPAQRIAPVGERLGGGLLG